MSTITEPTLLDELRSKLTDANGELDTLIDEREAAVKAFEERLSSEDDKPSDEERETFRASEGEFQNSRTELRERISALEGRVSDQEAKEQRRAAAAEAQKGGSAEVTSEPAVYRRDNAHEVSYLRDLMVTNDVLRQAVRNDWGPARERLARHGREIEEQLPKRQAEKERKAEEQVQEAEREFRGSWKEAPASVKRQLRGDLEYNPFERPSYSEQRANPSRTPGLGGEFVPPLWLIEDFIPALRAGRTIAPLCRNMELPPGTDTIKLPKVKVGSEVAPQLADNAGVASKDIESTFVEAAVKTLAGQEDVAIQVIEQSPGQIFDRVVMEDLLADYNLKVDQQVSFGTGSNYTELAGGTIKGLYPKSNWEATQLESTNAEGEKGVAGVYLAAMAASWSNIAKKRFSTSNVHHVINPRRAGFIAALLDGSESKTGRPFINASDFPNFNTAGLLTPDSPAEGLLWNTPLGPNVYATNNIHAEDNEKGAKSGTADYMLSAKFDDVWFFESDLRTRVLPEVLSGTLQIRFQVYAYITSLVRYGPSVCLAVGKPFKEPELFGFKF